jgi:[acyl-carrier-protein] S-malonyltransferase
MSRTVLLFPGQGAYVPGVLTTLSRELPELRLTFEEVDAVAAEAGLVSVSDAVAAAPRLDRLLHDEPAHILQLTLYASAVGMHRLLVAQGMRPVTLAGHSLGEIAALVCGGAFSFREGAQIVLHRTAVVEGLNPGGAMLAVGQTREPVQRLLDLVGDPDAVVAVENGPRQTVVSGSDKAVEAVEAIAKTLHISVVRLRSPFPFHSPLLAEASRQLASQLGHLQQRPLTAPVYSPILGRHYTDGDRLTDALAAHLTQPVRFSAALTTLKSSGAEVFVEAGIGDTLTKLVNSSKPDADAVACVDGRGNHLASLGRALERLAELGVVATSVIPDQTELSVPDVPGEWSAMGKVADYVLACLPSGTTHVLANGQSNV